MVLNQNWNKQWSCPKIFDTNLFLKRTISNTISYITLKDTINNEWLFWKMMLNIMNPPVWYKYNITRKDDARNAIFCLHDQIHTSTNNKLVLQLPFSAWNPFTKRIIDYCNAICFQLNKDQFWSFSLLCLYFVRYF